MKALFVTIEDIKQNSVLGGSIDPDKIIQFVNIAQDIYIQDYLGTELYTELQNGIINNDLSTDEITLIDVYIKPMLIHAATAEYLPFAAYTISNAGIYKHSSETSESVTKEEVDFLIQKSRKNADFYTQRFLAYMTYNQNLFPSYKTNTNDDISPNKDSNSSSWVF